MLHIVTRRPVLQKVRHHTLSCAVSACKHRVSGSLSLPSRGPFHLSLTVLYAIGHQVVFSLMRWSSHIHTGFHVSCATLDTRHLKSISSTRLSLCIVQLSRLCSTINSLNYAGPNPFEINFSGLGSFAFAHHYLRNRLFTFFSSGYLDVSVPRVPLLHTIYSYADTSALPEVSFLIRKSTGQSLFAAHRSLSQLVTSFFGAWCQGIHPMPLLALIIYV